MNKKFNKHHNKHQQILFFFFFFLCKDELLLFVVETNFATFCAFSFCCCLQQCSFQQTFSLLPNAKSDIQPNPPIHQSIQFIQFIQFNNQYFAFSTHFSTNHKQQQHIFTQKEEEEEKNLLMFVVMFIKLLIDTKPNLSKKYVVEK